MPDGQIFKATYSGIPVYEMMAKGVAVMRRRSDSWLNATQILKVAGFDKPQRTRVLEREVQKGEHEKVQGGYGKYQGTWIPLERGLELCRQYNCEILLRPLVDFQPAAKSPPLAPKHLVAPTSNRPHSRRPPVSGESAARQPTVNTRSTRKAGRDDGEESDVETQSIRGSEDGSMTPSPSEASSSSHTPSPIRSSPPLSGYGTDGMEDGRGSPPRISKQKQKHRRSFEYRHDDTDDERAQNGNDPSTYGDQILEYFISDTNQIPAILVNPPPDFDPNMAIDDDGHTALHWACAMGRIRVVKLLLTAGADIFKVNNSGQTPLMRSVMFANNYDVRKFPELYELLHRSTLNIDNHNRTVFHHIVDVAMSKGKTHAARYYMETLINRLADYPGELADIINFQDEEGETALTMAARCRSKRLVKILIDHGANPKIANRDSKTTEDYILEDERFRSSPLLPSRTFAMSYRNAQAAQTSSVLGSPGFTYSSVRDDRPHLHHSIAAQKASTRCVNDMAAMFDSLAASFDQELKDKERDMNQAKALLKNIEGEILESQRAVGHLKGQAQGLEDAKKNLAMMEEELRGKMGNRYRLGWEKWINEEEGGERAIRDAAGGELGLPLPSMWISSEQDSSLDTEAAKVKRKAQEMEIAELLALHSDIPTDPVALAEACEALRQDLVQRKKRRKDTFDEYVKFQAETGTSGRMSQYRRLIGAGCGGVPPGDVDNVLGVLLETLESEEPSSSSTAWTGMPPGPKPAVSVG